MEETQLIIVALIVILSGCLYFLMKISNLLELIEENLRRIDLLNTMLGSNNDEGNRDN